MVGLDSPQRVCLRTTLSLPRPSPLLRCLPPPPYFCHFRSALSSLESFPLSKIDKNLGGTEIVFVGGC